jgi:hypothetical protein
MLMVNGLPLAVVKPLRFGWKFFGNNVKNVQPAGTPRSLWPVELTVVPPRDRDIG